MISKFILFSFRFRSNQSSLIIKSEAIFILKAYILKMYEFIKIKIALPPTT